MDRAEDSPARTSAALGMGDEAIDLMNVTLTEPTSEMSAVPRTRARRERAPLGAAGFDALLAGLHLTPLPSFDVPVLTESQMFEAPRREGDHRPPAHDPGGDARARLDPTNESRTDVRARRGAAESLSRATEPVDPAPAKSSPPPGANTGAGESSPDHAASPVAPEAGSNRSAVEPAARRAPAGPVLPKEPPATARDTVSQPVVPTQGAPAATEVRLADARNGSSQTAAKAIVRVLGAAQSSAAESARSPSAGQDSLDQGKSSGGKSTARPESAEKQGAPHEATRGSSFARMVRSLRIRPGARNSSASIRLDPPRLGRMNVNVRMSGDRISIDVRTETKEARELVTARAMDLRTALERHGLQIERFDVRGDLIDAGMADRALGARTDDRDRKGSASSKRGSRRHAVGSVSAASDRVPAPDGSDVGDEGDTTTPHRADARAPGSGRTGRRRRHVDIRV